MSALEDGTAVTKDLNESFFATDVALNSVITITFDKDVDAATVNATNVSLASSAGTIGATAAAAGAVVTITPDGRHAA
ncbi:MAG: Ig-like domain-containing protein [Saprospiraceae bacterium]